MRTVPIDFTFTETTNMLRMLWLFWSSMEVPLVLFWLSGAAVIDEGHSTTNAYFAVGTLGGSAQVVPLALARLALCLPVLPLALDVLLLPAFRPLFRPTKRRTTIELMWRLPVGPVFLAVRLG